MRKDEKILEALSENFAEDPRALFAAFRFVVKKFSAFEKMIESSYSDVSKQSKKDLNAAVSNIQKAIEQRNVAILETVDKMIASSSKELLAAIKEDEKSSEWRKEIEKIVKKLDTEFRHRLDSLSNKKESGGSIVNGGAGRAVYFSGTYPNYYSDLNFIPGSGVTIAAVPNETTQRVDVTITSTASGGGINPQVPAGTVNSSNRTFTCTGIVSVAIVDGTVDVGAVISGATNSTIFYSVPPQNNVYAF